MIPRLEDIVDAVVVVDGVVVQIIVVSSFNRTGVRNTMYFFLGLSRKKILHSLLIFPCCYLFSLIHSLNWQIKYTTLATYGMRERK